MDGGERWYGQPHCYPFCYPQNDAQSGQFLLPILSANICQENCSPLSISHTLEQHFQRPLCPDTNYMQFSPKYFRTALVKHVFTYFTASNFFRTRCHKIRREQEKMKRKNFNDVISCTAAFLHNRCSILKNDENHVFLFSFDQISPGITSDVTVNWWLSDFLL